jgi:small ligand-binding sensory domain FIST
MACAASSCLVEGPFHAELIKQTASQLLAKIGGKATCAFAFVSQDYKEHLEEFCELIRLFSHVSSVFGCTGSGFIGAGIEMEATKGFSLILLNLPNTKITPFEFSQSQIVEAGGPSFWHTESGIGPDEVDAWIAMTDPLSIPIESWLADWNLAYPDVPCIGGLASSIQNEQPFIVFHNGKIVKKGGLAVALSGGVKVRTVVSQGCRPIGEPLTITRADRNLVLTLGSRNAFEVLSEVIGGLDNSEQELAKGNIFAGLATSEYVDDFKQGDFLIRNILGADPSSGAVALGAHPRVGQTMQYQLRDKNSASAELITLLKRVSTLKTKPFAALAFACNGRGSHLFGDLHHDSQAIVNALGPLPSAGFFCNGEIGPVGKKNYVHGYTLSVALFMDKARPKETPAAET